MAQAVEGVSGVPLLRIKITPKNLENINLPNAVDANKKALAALGGAESIAKKLAGNIYFAKKQTQLIMHHLQMPSYGLKVESPCRQD